MGEGHVYVFSSWMPMRAKGWSTDVQEDAGDRLAELCFLSAPPSLIELPKNELRAAYPVFPKTLSRWDFLACGLDNEEVGLFHSQLFILPRLKGAPTPYIAAPLRHERGDVTLRMSSSPALRGVNLCRGLGLLHVHGPADFSRPIPAQLLGYLQESVCNGLMAKSADGVLEHLRQSLEFLTGPPQRQIAAVMQLAPSSLHSSSGQVDCQSDQTKK